MARLGLVDVDLAAVRGGLAPVALEKQGSPGLDVQVMQGSLRGSRCVRIVSDVESSIVERYVRLDAGGSHAEGGEDGIGDMPCLKQLSTL